MNQPDVTDQDKEILNEQMYNQINLKITALHTAGTNYEKLNNFDMALHNFKLGKEFIEANFGSEH